MLGHTMGHLDSPPEDRGEIKRGVDFTEVTQPPPTPPPDFGGGISYSFHDGKGYPFC
jgi:hypothetical protein